MNIVAVIIAFVMGLLFPRSVKNQTKNRKARIAREADRFGISIFDDIDH